MQEPTPEQVLQFARQIKKPFLTSADASERFPSVSSKTVRKRLNTLVERGDLEVARVGAKSKVWYPSDYASPRSDASDSRSLPASESQ